MCKLTQQSVVRALCKTPKRIILMRHGESTANKDSTVYTHTPDWNIPLTDKGLREANAAGTNLRALLNGEPAIVQFSPYRRARETALAAMAQLDPTQILFDGEEVRLREQDVGNFQDREDQEQHWAERDRFGRFFYRFPNGESGADVCDRVLSFIDSMMRSFRLHSENPDINAIICSHGLTIRLFIMRWFHIASTDLERLKNPPNASLLVLERKSYSHCGKIARYELTEESKKLIGVTEDMLKNHKRRLPGKRNDITIV